MNFELSTRPVCNIIFGNIFCWIFFYWSQRLMNVTVGWWRTGPLVCLCPFALRMWIRIIFCKSLKRWFLFLCFVLVLSEIYSVIKSWHIHSWNIPMNIMTMIETYVQNNSNYILHSKFQFFSWSKNQEKEHQDKK